MTNGVDLPTVDASMIEEALELVREYMNNVSGHYQDTKSSYDPIMGPGDGEALVMTLKLAARYEELVRSGDVSRGDWRQGEWHDA